MVSQIANIKTVKVQSEIESLLLEVNLIQKYFPKYNVRFADGKAYPLIKITIKDKFPKVLVSRRMDDKSSVYFGPFPNTGAMRTVLKIVRRIFPFQSVLNHGKRLCLYNHLGLCPCPEVTNDPTYRKNILHLVNFLKGNTKKVIKELARERNMYSKDEKFEEAREAQRKIEAIKVITALFYEPSSYEENPNLQVDVRKEELESLTETLKKYGLKINFPSRIECYDISIISGTNATGSMVVFIDGEKNNSLYRKFRIRKTFGKNNDFEMIEEVIQRRLGHPEWPTPDLIIIDGGKGQITSVTKILNKNKLNIPLIGLAKREETIITSDFKEIDLPKDSKALHLVMRIRDEAHRFAITYHKKLRSNFLKF